MTEQPPACGDDPAVDPGRRHFIGGLAALAGGAAAAGPAQAAWGGRTLQDALGGFFQDHYQRMTPQ